MTTPGRRTLAHLSDLHLGLRDAGPRLDALVAALVAEQVDHVVVTGDVTDRGRAQEWSRFERAMEPLGARLTVLPGNHDRLGDDVGARIFKCGRRVTATWNPGLWLVAVDSTGPHNRFLLTGHGALDERDLDEIDEAVDSAPVGALTVVALHHHPLPAPGEMLIERVAGWLGMPNAAELPRGPELLARLLGRCDLVLHGHRHRPAAALLGDGTRPLGVYNAGSSTELGRVRLFSHRDGRVLGKRWLEPMSQAALATAVAS